MTLYRAPEKNVSKITGMIYSLDNNTHKTETKKHLVANRHDRRRFAAAAKSFHKKYGIPSPLTFEQYIEYAQIKQ